MLALLMLAVVSYAAAVAEAPPFEWPVPSGWKKETIPFPLEFAPSIRHEGVEELRFAPNFFRPEAPGYWSYAFVWWLKDPTTPEASALSSELARYFEGLSTAVGGKKFRFDRSHFKAAISGTKEHFAGTAQLYDAFTTGRPLSLRIEGQAIDCASQSRHAVLFLLSPKPSNDPIWKELRERAASFRCSPKA